MPQPAVVTRPRNQTPVRHDPKPRHSDGVKSWTQLKNADPTRSYVLVNDSGAGVFDVDYYLNIAEGLERPADEGYVVERKRPDGVKLRTGNTTKGNDDIIRFRGMVLMSCPIEFKKFLDDVGVDGESGQKGADRNDRLVRGRMRRGVFDDLEGIESKSSDGDPYVIKLNENELRE